jgi:hypothetical protein
MSNPPIKAASRDFTDEPFFLTQSKGSEKRYIVSLKDKISIRVLLAGFINECTSEVQVKITDFENPDGPVDYYGSSDKPKLHQLMTKYEDVIFHNGFHDLMLRNPASGEYIVFDEHGLIFIYTSQDYAETLKNLHAEYKPDEKMIYEFSHWHYCMAGSKEKLAGMIAELGLEKD